MTRTLSFYDTTGIQAYLYESNRLLESLGGSALVVDALEQWLPDAAGVARAPWDRWRDTPGPPLPNGPADAVEPLYTGGGNAVLIAGGEQRAVAVARAWSTRLYRDAPGLRGVAVHRPWPPGEPLGKALAEGFALLEGHKQAARPAGLPLRLPVSRPCDSTGLAANGVEPGEQGGYLSAAAQARRQAGRTAARRLDGRFLALVPDWHFTDQQDRLGGTEGQAHIAVVHADGNGLGGRIAAVLAGDKTDDGLAADLRRLSLAAAAAVRAATEATVKRLAAAMADPQVDLVKALGLTIFVDEHRSPAFPFRPVVEGGDDVTFVCDGRLGLALAAIWLEEFGRAGQAESLSACAGVAVTPAKFPFRRAYDLAGQLTASAKQEARQWQENHPDQPPGAWLDYELAIGDALTPPPEQRALLQTALRYAPVARPLRVTPDGPDEHDWSEFVKVARIFSSAAWPRSRVQAVREAAGQGRPALRALLGQFASRGIHLPGTRAQEQPGLDPAYPGLYRDAAEALDHLQAVLLLGAGTPDVRAREER